jgi:hypothetical protein
MNNDFTNNQKTGEWADGYHPGRVTALLVGAITVATTSVVTFAVTLAVTLLVLLGIGWWLYTVLPTNIFNILVAFVLIDILLGIVLRFVLTRRGRKNESR